MDTPVTTPTETAEQTKPCKYHSQLSFT
jgi:hypothetical protein